MRTDAVVNHAVCCDALTGRRGKTGVKIGGEIVERFEPHRQTQHAVGDAQLSAGLWADAMMRSCCRMSHKALSVAEIVGNPYQSQGIL